MSVNEYEFMGAAGQGANLSALVALSGDNDKNTTEKKTRREIANSNERRRMQSINTGFMRLKALVPSISKEKVSKATILQQTGEYIEKLEREKKQLKALLKSKDPSFSFLDIEVDEEDTEVIQVKTEPFNDSQSSSSMTLDSPVNLSSLPSMNTQGASSVIDRTRQMLLSAQLLQSLTALQNPLALSTLNSSNGNSLCSDPMPLDMKTDPDFKPNQLSSILQAMLKNGQANQE